MILKELKGITFNKYGNTKDKLPEGWVEVIFNLRKKNHRIARDSQRTRIVQKFIGWGGTRKFPKAEVNYWTDTPEVVKSIMEHGDITNVEHFMLELDGDITKE